MLVGTFNQIMIVKSSQTFIFSSSQQPLSAIRDTMDILSLLFDFYSATSIMSAHKVDIQIRVSMSQYRLELW